MDRIYDCINKRKFYPLVAIVFVALVSLSLLLQGGSGVSYAADEEKKEIKKETVELPKPNIKGKMPIEKAIKERRSRRKYAKGELTKDEVGQIMWAAYGVTMVREFQRRDGSKFKFGFRSVPSGGAMYPLDVYIVVGKDSVKGMKAGFYHYIPEKHQLELIKEGDLRPELQEACWEQSMVTGAQISIVITAEYERITKRYKERGKIFAVMESGCISQNIHLQCESLNLSTVMIGAFKDDAVAGVLPIPETHKTLMIMPVGKRAIETSKKNKKGNRKK